MCNFEVFISIRRSHCVGFFLYLIYCLLEHILSGWLVGGCREGSRVGRLRQLFNSLCLNPGVDVVCLYHP